MIRTASHTIADYLAAVERVPPQVDGHLTVLRGFLPPTVRTAGLTGPHREWEQAVEGLNDLAFSSRAQSTLDGLSLLPATADHLPDNQVKWAATLLGTLAHAYWRFGIGNLYQPRNCQISAHLPEAIKRPWEEVCRRMGRSFCGFTLEDQMFNNFTFDDPARLAPGGEYHLRHVRTEDLRLLAPAYGNRTERVFLCVFAEIHAALTPALSELIRLEELMASGDPDVHHGVIGCMQRIGQCLRTASSAFRKVSPNPRSRTHCDPIEWAKTVVTFTVPAPGYPVGPSGSAAPIVHLMDALIGRKSYNSELGAFSAMLRGSQLPRTQQVFFDLVRGLGLRDWVLGLTPTGGTRLPETVEAFNTMVDDFAGPNGFLGVHKAKVVDYLGVGTLVGRNQSTAHHQTYISDRSWTTMAGRLHITMGERRSMLIPDRSPSHSGETHCIY